ncbi:MAG TPA: hypothetical protein PKA58_13685, partial [Polyangium sp.]|nr:hypothetical protein [Polyangium sp.]
MPAVRRRSLLLLPALLLASSFGVVCSSTPPTPNVAPPQPAAAIAIVRETDVLDKPVVFPPAMTRTGRLPLRDYDANNDASKLSVTSPSLNAERAFSFHDTSFSITFNQPVAQGAAAT